MRNRDTDTNRRSLLGRAMQRVLERRARRRLPYGTRRRLVRDPCLESELADPDRHAAIMASIERQVDELGPVTR